MKSVAAALVAAFVLAGAASASAETITVNSTADGDAVNAAVSCMDSSGECTLRSAIERANSLGGSNTISLPAGDYKLTLGGDGGTGELSVTNSDQLTITGAGASTTTVDANFIDRAFFLDSDGSTLTLNGMTVQNGRPGNLGDTSTCPAELPQNQNDGGAILAEGPLTLSNDVITGNLTAGEGGGVAFEGQAGDSTSALTVSGTTVSHNMTCDSQGGDGLTDGGGIYEDSGFNVTNAISSSTIEDNTVPADTGFGGGVAAEGLAETMNITNSTISNNVAEGGGGINASSSTEGPGALNMSDDTIAGNSTDSTVNPQLRRAAQAALVVGAYGPGGGVLVAFDSLSMVNSTVTANAATDGGGVATDGFVPGTISFSTITGNSASGSPGDSGNSTGNIEDLLSGGEGPAVTLDDTIVANGTSPTGNPTNCNDGASLNGGIASGGNNLFDDTSDSGAQCGAVSSDLVKAFFSFNLAALANNGGPTETEALQLGSPAVNAANDSLCSSEANSLDQRGITRPQGPHCDIGAFELEYADLAVTSSASPTTIYVGQTSTITDVVTNNGPTTATGVTLTDPAPTGITIESASSSQGSCTHTTTTVTCSLGTLAAGGKATITIIEKFSASGSKTTTATVTGTLADPASSNNTSSATVTVLPLADLALKKSASHGHVTEGAKDTFTLTVTNNGPSTATGVTLTDKLPAGLSFVSSKPSQGKCSGHGTVSCQLGSLESGHKATVRIVARATRAGKIRNTAHVTGTVKDPDTGNNSASASISVKSACKENLVFRTNYKPVDKVTTVKVYVDGRLRQTLHGSNIRVVRVKPVPMTGVHSVTVMFIIAPFETVTATRTYTNCGSGPTHYSYPPQTNPGAS